MRRIELEQYIAAPPSRVWPVLCDHEGMPRWMPVREVVRRRPGSPEPNGVGAIRTIRGMGLVMEEHITGWKSGERFEYVLKEGAPLRDHIGEMVVEPTEDGTLVRWCVQFRPLVPGTGPLIEHLVRAGLHRGLGRLKRLIESSENTVLERNSRDKEPPCPRPRSSRACVRSSNLSESPSAPRAGSR
ncbi:MAG TPA: hypothetical protein DEP35_07545 [Deltaproteobacteria bacterium]|nr:hypothetical protein [Deltaproteobacteria bacterium]